MSKNKKNLIMLVVLVIFAGGLTGFYFWNGSRQQKLEAEAQAQAEAEATPDPAQTLIDRAEDDISEVTFTTQDHSLTLMARRETDEEDQSVTTWVLKDDPEVIINQTIAKDMVRAFYYLSITDTVEKNVSDPASFGIGPEGAVAVATYTDGSQATVRVGMMTPAKDRYYLMLEGNPDLYTVYTYYGDRYFNGVGELIDKTLPSISSESMEYVYMKERDKQPLEFGFYGTEEEKAEMLESYGVIYVTMLQPYPGRELYYSNFEGHVLEDFSSFSLGDLVALKPEDLSIYGLADPSLEFWLKGPDDELHLLFGDRTEDGHIYVKFFDRPHVFLAEYDFVKGMYNVNVFTFIERFVALVDIYTCETIDIVWNGDPSRSHHARLDLIQPENEDEFEYIDPYVDGQLVQELAFKTFYQRVIGLSYDTEIEVFEPAEEPVFTITYTIRDGDPIVVRFFDYDAHFYAVQRDDNPVQFVSNKQAAELVFQSAIDLLAGNLDREY